MEILPLLKQTWKEYNQDEVPRRAAALAYYTILSLAPLLIIAIAIVGFFFGKTAATGQIVNQFSDLVGEQGASAIQAMIIGAQKPTQGILATLFSVITLLLGASGVFGELYGTLNKMWSVHTKEGFWEQIRVRFFSYIMVLGVGFLLLVSLTFSAGLAALGKYFGNVPLISIIEIVVSFAIITLLFALMLKEIPETNIPWKPVWIGALLTSLLFAIGKYALGLYLGRLSVASSYGAAGSLVIILIWVYYSSQIFFLGAEFTQVLSTRLRKAA